MSQDLFGSDRASPPTTPIVGPVSVVSATSDLDEAAAARLLRCCEARLHLLDLGQVMLGHLVVDLTHARRTTPPAVAILDHARAEAGRRHVGIHLVGAGPLMAASSLQVRRHLGRWSTFPTLDAAHAALAPPGHHEGDAPDRAVDPDAIVFNHPIP